jgi:excisionase family DNA binding protein
MAKSKSPTNRDLLSVRQAAIRLKVSPANIYDAISRGRIVPLRIGDMVLVSRPALEAYGKSRKRTGRPAKKKKR